MFIDFTTILQVDSPDLCKNTKQMFYSHATVRTSLSHLHFIEGQYRYLKTRLH